MDVDQKEEMRMVRINERTGTDNEPQERKMQVIGTEDEVGNCGDSSPLDELVKEQYFGEGVKIDDSNQFVQQTTCKSVCDKRNDHDIHQERNQQNESGRDRTDTTAASQEWLKKNPDSEITLSVTYPWLSEEKDKIASCFHEDRKWLKSQPSISDVQQEFTPLTSKEGSLLIVTEELYDASSQKFKERNAKESDSSPIMMEGPPEFISLQFEKKKSFCSEFHFRITDNNACFVSKKNTCNKKWAEDMERNANTTDNVTVVPEMLSDFISLKSEKTNKALFSKCYFTVTDNHMSFVSMKKKNAIDKIHLKEEVKLISDSKQVITSSVRVFFKTEGKCLDQKNNSDETEQQILSDIDVTVLGVDINERTGKNIDLQEKKKHYHRQIVWLPRNWLPLPRLDRDAIVGFVERQTHDGHGWPHAENEELREILRQLASDNVPGPQITMKYEMLRLCTMKTFPGQDRPFAFRIVGAGFYYAGHKDQVICYCCGSRKEGWVLGDIPLLIHQNMAPGCGFLSNNALVNVPIRKANCIKSPADIRLLTVQRSEGSNQSDMSQGKSSLMLSSSEQNQASISNMVSNRSSPASGRQNVFDKMQAVPVDTYSMEEPHPQYAVKNMRINSFQGWPAEHQQKPEEMAECGFYYAGFSDCVRCFHCRVGLRHWMSEDDPWIEHARWSTECIYVLKMKGEEFVNLVQMAVEIDEREKTARSNSRGNQATELFSEAAPAVIASEASSNSNIANSMTSKDIKYSTGVKDGNVTGTGASTPSPSKNEIEKYLLTDAAQSVLDMGHKPRLVLRAIERALLKKGTEQLTGQIIMEALFEIEEEKRVEPNPRGSVQSAAGHKIIGKANMNSEASNKQDGHLRAKAAEDETVEELQIDPEKIMREHNELHKATLCKICLENATSVVFLPCGHLVTCPDCAPAMRKCPICNELVKERLNTSTK